MESNGETFCWKNIKKAERKLGCFGKSIKKDLLDVLRKKKELEVMLEQMRK